MTGRFYIDDQGHLWPITGHYCRTCGLPLIVVAAGQQTHPGCSLPSTAPREET